MPTITEMELPKANPFDTDSGVDHGVNFEHC